MTQLADRFFPPIAQSKMPYWRFMLRGCSQLCFQSNEVTGLCFLAAVLVASPIAFVYMLVASAIAPAARMLLGAKRATLETGLPGLNPCLIALSLPAFFETGWTNFSMWGMLVVCVVVVVVLVHYGVATLPFPILAAPFVLVFWVLNAIASHVGVLEPLDFSSAPTDRMHPVNAVFFSMGQVAFSPTFLSGVLIAAGVLIGNWRHGLVALCGALIGALVSYYSGVSPANINLGLFGFNAVLASVSVYVVCGGSLRLAILGGVIATMLIPLISDFGLPSLSAPFVLATWIVMILGWFENKVFNEPDDPLPPASGDGETSEQAAIR